MLRFVILDNFTELPKILTFVDCINQFRLRITVDIIWLAPDNCAVDSLTENATTDFCGHTAPIQDLGKRKFSKFFPKFISLFKGSQLILDLELSIVTGKWVVSSSPSI